MSLDGNLEQEVQETKPVEPIVEKEPIDDALEEEPVDETATGSDEVIDASFYDDALEEEPVDDTATGSDEVIGASSYDDALEEEPVDDTATGSAEVIGASFYDDALEEEPVDDTAIGSDETIDTSAEGDTLDENNDGNPEDENVEAHEETSDENPEDESIENPEETGDENPEDETVENTEETSDENPEDDTVEDTEETSDENPEVESVENAEETSAENPENETVEDTEETSDENPEDETVENTEEASDENPETESVENAEEDNEVDPKNETGSDSEDNQYAEGRYIKYDQSNIDKMYNADRAELSVEEGISRTKLNDYIDNSDLPSELKSELKGYISEAHEGVANMDVEQYTESMNKLKECIANNGLANNEELNGLVNKFEDASSKFYESNPEVSNEDLAKLESYKNQPENAYKEDINATGPDNDMPKQTWDGIYGKDGNEHSILGRLEDLGSDFVNNVPEAVKDIINNPREALGDLAEIGTYVAKHSDFSTVVNSTEGIFDVSTVVNLTEGIFNVSRDVKNGDLQAAFEDAKDSAMEVFEDKSLGGLAGATKNEYINTKKLNEFYDLLKEPTEHFGNRNNELGASEEYNNGDDKSDGELAKLSIEEDVMKDKVNNFIDNGDLSDDVNKQNEIDESSEVMIKSGIIEISDGVLEKALNKDDLSFEAIDKINVIKEKITEFVGKLPTDFISNLSKNIQNFRKEFSEDYANMSVRDEIKEIPNYASLTLKTAFQTYTPGTIVQNIADRISGEKIDGIKEAVDDGLKEFFSKPENMEKYNKLCDRLDDVSEKVESTMDKNGLSGDDIMGYIVKFGQDIFEFKDNVKDRFK